MVIVLISNADDDFFFEQGKLCAGTIHCPLAAKERIGAGLDAVCTSYGSRLDGEYDEGNCNFLQPEYSNAEARVRDCGSSAVPLGFACESIVGDSEKQAVWVATK